MFFSIVGILGVALYVIIHILLGRRKSRETINFLRAQFPAPTASAGLPPEEEWDLVEVAVFDEVLRFFGQVTSQGLEIYNFALQPGICFVVPAAVMAKARYQNSDAARVFVSIAREIGPDLTIEMRVTPELYRIALGAFAVSPDRCLSIE